MHQEAYLALLHQIQLTFILNQEIFQKKNLIGNIKKGIYLTELMGSSVNLINGDYSRGGSGFWIDKGEITYPINEITIADNLNEMFKRIILADDLEFKQGLNSPTMLIENMTVAG